MTSKAYFTVSGIFIALYILTSFGVLVGLPEGVHQFCTVVFAGAAFLGWRKKKQEQGR
jgi:type III secretory pathway component EscV